METSIALLITTVIMALGAITFSALNMAFDRSHHRKSVRPFCNVNQNITDNGMCISIENAGMGPMLIQTILLLKNQDDPIETGVPFTRKCFLEFDCDVFTPNSEIYVLPPLGKLNLFQITTGISDNGVKARLKDKMNGRCLCIKYTDIYDSTYETKAVLTINS